MVYTHIYVYLCVSQRINTKSFTMKGEGLETEENRVWNGGGLYYVRFLIIMCKFTRVFFIVKKKYTKVKLSVWH